VPALLLTILFIVIGWFLIIRPQQQRMREQREVVASLQPGDRVITAGGIHGRLVTVDDETVEVEVALGVVLTLARPAIARRLDDDPVGPPGHAAPEGFEPPPSPGIDPAGEDPR